MKKVFAIIVAALAFGAVAPAAAPAASVSGVTLLSTDYWLGLPNGTQRTCNSNPCFGSFQWTGTVPGNDTTIRIVGPVGNELWRARIPGGQCCASVIIPYGTQFHWEGRSPTGEKMQNYHSYTAYW